MNEGVLCPAPLGGHGAPPGYRVMETNTLSPLRSKLFEELLPQVCENLSEDGQGWGFQAAGGHSRGFQGQRGAAAPQEASTW